MSEAIRDDADSRFRARQVTRPRDQVEQQLREAIFTGKFAQGDKLPAETELAQLFGVSRPTVREALGALVTAGLIRKIPGAAVEELGLARPVDEPLLDGCVDGSLAVLHLRFRRWDMRRSTRPTPSSCWTSDRPYASG